MNQHVKIETLNKPDSPAEKAIRDLEGCCCDLSVLTSAIIVVQFDDYGKRAIECLSDMAARRADEAKTIVLDALHAMGTK